MVHHNPEIYTVMCGGCFHRSITGYPDFPRYSSIWGLLEEPDSIYYNLCLAAMQSDINVVKETLARNPRDLNSTWINDDTPLHYAVVSNTSSKEVVEFLISKGADINAKNREGATPLDKAAAAGNREMFLLLLKHGAEVNRDLLHYAAMGGNIHIVRIAFSKGADPMCRNKKKETPLHHVKTVEAARFLIQKGARVNARDANGRTPLHYALSADVARYLVSKGAKL